MSRIHDALKKAELERQKALGSKGGSPTGMSTTIRSKILLPGAKPESADSSSLGEAAVPAGEVDSSGSSAAPSWKPDPSRLLFLGQSPTGPGTEAFRTLRTRLHLLRKQRPLQKILITSPFSKDGKTFVSANLGQALAQQGQSVLLIDADLRFSMLHASFGAALTPGLTDYLNGECDQKVIVQKSPSDNLFLIAGGKHMEGATELLATSRFEELLTLLAPDFDWIILDSPPVVPVSDAKIIGELCDGAIVVARSGSTTLPWAQKACREIGDANLLGIVLNGVDPKSERVSSYYYKKDKGT
jgi:tyrosine-protein kinase Etk/Wzc